MTRGAIWWSATAVLAVGVLTPAMARPNYLATFKDHYKTATSKPRLNAANCALCHIGAPNTRRWNPYGEAVRTALAARMVTDRAKIVAAITAAEKGKRTPNARRNFGSFITMDQFPIAQQMAANAPPRAGAPAAVGGPATLGNAQWEPLFNGTNMDGWTKLNQGNWTVQNGILKYTGGGNGWLRSNRQFTNYSMVVVWRYPQPSPQNDSGIFLKARPGDNGSPWPSAPQLNMGPADNFGSIGGTQGARARADLIRRADWNTYQITVANGAAVLSINGTPAWQQATGANLGGAGHIGIQCENQALDIAQVWVRPLP